MGDPRSPRFDPQVGDSKWKALGEKYVIQRIEDGLLICEKSHFTDKHKSEVSLTRINWENAGNTSTEDGYHFDSFEERNWLKSMTPPDPQFNPQIGDSKWQVWSNDTFVLTRFDGDLLVCKRGKKEVRMTRAEWEDPGKSAAYNETGYYYTSAKEKA